MNTKIPLFKIYWDKDDIKGVTSVIESGMSWAIGSNIKKFEKLLIGYLGVKYALVFNSGTSALHALMIAYKIGPGDEVLVPSFTFIATANAVLFTGAKPVFVEIENKTYGLDPEDLEKKITKKTKAIIPIHYGGHPCQIEEIKRIAKKHKLILIEDAAESLGAKINNRMVGTFGDSAILSFCQNKIITTGEGGAVITNSKKIYEELKLIRSHGRLENEDYFSSNKNLNYISLGYNFRMSNILAALGLSQLKKIKRIIKTRIKNSEYLSKKLSDIKDIITPESPKKSFSVYQMYTIRLIGGKRKRDALSNYLKDEGIKTKVFFNPVHLTKFYKTNFGYKKGDLPITEKISDRVLTLPMHPALTKKEMDYIIKKLVVFFEK